MYFDLIYPWLQVNIAPDAASKLANDFSPAELEYFRKVVSCISYFVMLIISASYLLTCIVHMVSSLALYNESLSFCYQLNTNIIM